MCNSNKFTTLKQRAEFALTKSLENLEENFPEYFISRQRDNSTDKMMNEKLNPTHFYGFYYFRFIIIFVVNSHLHDVNQ